GSWLPFRMRMESMLEHTAAAIFHALSSFRARECFTSKNSPAKRPWLTKTRQQRLRNADLVGAMDINSPTKISTNLGLSRPPLAAYPIPTGLALRPASRTSLTLSARPRSSGTSTEVLARRISKGKEDSDTT